MTLQTRSISRRRTGIGAAVLLVALTACASTPPPSATAPFPEQRAKVGVPDAPPDLPDNVPTALILGSALLESGNVRSALSYYRFAWESTPDDPYIARRFVDVALRAGSAEDALSALDVLVDSEPDAVDLAYQRAELLALTGKPDLALAAVDTLLARVPGDRYARQLRIDLLQDTGQTIEALKAIDLMIEDDPDEVAWLVRRGDLLMELERPAQAEKAWRAALTRDGSSVEAVDRYAELLRSQGRGDELVEFLSGLAADGTLGPAQQLRLADLYLARDEREKAVAVLIPLAERGELDMRERRVVADLLASLDRHEEAVEVLMPLLEEGEPGSAEVMRAVGELRMEQGDFGAAVEFLEHAIEIDPSDGDAHVSLLLALSQSTPELFDATAPESARQDLARRVDAAEGAIAERSVRQNFLMGALLRRASLPERAQPYLERAAALDPTNDQILYDLAVVQENNADFEGARTTLEKLIELDPEDAHLKNFYGYLLADRGWELEKAERLIREALATDEENGAYIDSLGWVLFRQGRYEEALEELIDAVNRLGDDPIVLEHLAECLAAMERHEEALSTFQRARSVGGAESAHLDARIQAMQELLGEGP